MLWSPPRLDTTFQQDYFRFNVEHRKIGLSTTAVLSDPQLRAAFFSFSFHRPNLVRFHFVTPETMEIGGCFYHVAEERGEGRMG